MVDSKGTFQFLEHDYKVFISQGYKISVSGEDDKIRC